MTFVDVISQLFSRVVDIATAGIFRRCVSAVLQVLFSDVSENVSPDLYEFVARRAEISIRGLHNNGSEHFLLEGA